MDRLTEYLHEPEAAQLLAHLTGQRQPVRSTMWRYREQGIEPHNATRKTYLKFTRAYNGDPMYAVQDLVEFARLLSPNARHRDVEGAAWHPEQASSEKAPGAAVLPQGD